MSFCPKTIIKHICYVPMLSVNFIHISAQLHCVKTYFYNVYNNKTVKEKGDHQTFNKYDKLFLSRSCHLEDNIKLKIPSNKGI